MRYTFDPPCIGVKSGQQLQTDFATRTYRVLDVDRTTIVQEGKLLVTELPQLTWIPNEKVCN
jgi:hypothetical protein